MTALAKKRFILLFGDPSNIALTGSSASASAGGAGFTFPVGISVALSGQQLTTAQGAFRDQTFGLSGVAATAEQGNLYSLPNGLQINEALVTNSVRLKWFLIASPVAADVVAGASAAASAGTLKAVHATALSGSAATSAAGSVSSGAPPALAGAQATAAAGNITVSLSEALSGTGATTSAGSITTTFASPTYHDRVLVAHDRPRLQRNLWFLDKNTYVPLTGHSATATAGNILPPGAKLLTGAVATAQTGIVPRADRTVSLTGLLGTSAVGSLVATPTFTLGSLVATTAPGSVTQSLTRVLAGVAATAQPGSVQITGNGGDVGLAGQGAASLPGTVGGVLSAALAGVAATSSAGTPAIAKDLAPAGLAATGEAGVLAPFSSRDLSGEAGSTETGVVTYSADQTITLAGLVTTVIDGTLYFVRVVPSGEFCLVPADFNQALVPPQDSMLVFPDANTVSIPIEDSQVDI